MYIYIINGGSNLGGMGGKQIKKVGLDLQYICFGVVTIKDY
jgi:hypothetical protein